MLFRSKIIASILIIVVLFPMLFTGCYDSIEIDDEVYAIAVGVDKGTGQNLKVTLQYPIYKGGGKGGGGGGSEGKENGQVDSTIVSTIEAPSILEAINMLNTSLGRRVSLMHSKMLVLSEEIAKIGVGRYIAPFTRFRETRRTMRVVVSKSNAEELLMDMKSLIGESSPKSIELLFEQYKTNGFFPNTSLQEFYKDMTTTYEQPFAISANLNELTGKGQFSQSENSGTKDSPDLSAGSLARKGGSKVELIGTDLFKGDKMTGSLDGYETRFFMMVQGEFKRGNLTLNDINSPGNILVFDVRQGRSPKLSVDFSGNKPVLGVELNIEADIVSIQSRINYERSTLLGGLEVQLKTYLTNGITQMIKKTQQIESDAIGFGRKAAHHFATIKEWEDYRWLSRYKDADVNVNVKVNIRRTGLMYEAADIVAD